MPTIGDLLQTRPYPGRGCAAIRTSGGDLSFVYFLTGRSSASKNREIVPAPHLDLADLGLPDPDLVVRGRGEGVFDALRHYRASVRRGGWTVVGNGDQVEPIALGLAGGRELQDVWSEHTYEPDPPIFTTRIALAHRAGGADCLFGFARRSRRPAGSVDRIVWAVDDLAPGSGVLMTTYAATADHVVSTDGPSDITVADGDRAAVLDEVWQALDPNLRVAAFAISPDEPESRPVIVAA